MSETFDPKRHLISYGNVRDYLPVPWRLVWVRNEHPAAVILTEPHVITDKWAVFRADVSLPTGARATGWGTCTSTKSASDYVERAETTALGRALKALGYGTEFDEDDDEEGATLAAIHGPAERATEKPASGPADKRAATTTTSKPPAATGKPLRVQLFEAYTAAQWSADKYGAMLKARYSKERTDQLSDSEMVDAIAVLSGKATD